MKSSSKGFLGQRVVKPASPENLSNFDAGIASLIRTDSKSNVVPNLSPLETKQIARSIFLEKEMMLDESGEKFYMFRLVSQTLKIVEFVADFTGSRNCDFVDLKKPKAEGEEKYNLKSDGVYLERVYPTMVHTETGHAEVCEK